MLAGWCAGLLKKNSLPARLSRIAQTLPPTGEALRRVRELQRHIFVKSLITELRRDADSELVVLQHENREAFGLAFAAPRVIFEVR